MQTIDMSKWQQSALAQPVGKNWCYAAVLRAVTHYLIDTKISMEDFVEFAFGDRASNLTPDWTKYMQIANKLTVEGIEYSREGAGRRKLIYDLDMEHGLPDGLVKREIEARRPLLCTIAGGAHDVVIVGAEFDGVQVSRVLYWNPSDNGIGNLSRQGFNELNPVCTFSVNILMEFVAFRPGGNL